MHTNFEPKQKKKPMTLIVGAICKDAIIVGSESETTYEDSKYQGTQKITLIPFENTTVIVGESGAADGSGPVVSTFRMMAERASQTDELTISKLVEAAFRDVASRKGGDSVGTRASQDYYCDERNYFELTIAYYFEGKPYICTMNPVHVVSREYRCGFTASGSGRHLAQYLMKDFNLGLLDSRGAIAAVAHVVRESKTLVKGCGGNTEIAVVSSHAKPEKLTREMIDKMDTDLNRLSEEIRASRASGFAKLLEENTPAYQGQGYGGNPIVVD
jgi:20S proteasome alpha/beta subunit